MRILVFQNNMRGRKMEYLNITKLQKVNALAKELKSHGFVNDMNAAYSEARTLANSSEELAFLSKAGGAQHNDEVVARDEPYLNIPAAAQDAPASPEASKLLADQEARIKSMEDVMMKMQHVLNDVLSQLSDLRSQAADRKLNAPAPGLRQEASEPAAPASISEPTPRGCVELPRDPPAAKRNDPPVEHPRQGKYTSNDVSIDKFFYFGNKKQQ